MNRQQKEELVGSLRDSFAQNQAAFLVCYRGLRVDQLEKLRAQLRSEGGSLKIAKARLMKRAVENVEGMGDLTPHLRDQVGVAFAASDSAGVAKLLHEFSKEHNQLQLVVGCIDAKLFDAQAVGRIAKLPSREVLLAQVCGTMKAPIAAYVHVLRTLLLQLLWTLNQVAEKRK